VSESKFKVGDRVVAQSTNRHDNENGINDGSVGTVRELTTDSDNLYNVVFDGITPTKGVSNERNGAWVMYEHQLKIAPAVAADPVAEATAEYQRLLREYDDAQIAQRNAEDALREAEKRTRNIGHQLNLSALDVERVNHEVAGVQWMKPDNYESLRQRVHG
jgi:hypothetical protein